MKSFENAEKAIKSYFSDTSNSPEQTKEGLQELREQIDVLIDALASDGVK